MPAPSAPLLHSTPLRYVRIARALALFASLHGASCPSPTACNCPVQDGGVPAAMGGSAVCNAAQEDAGCSSTYSVGPLAPPDLGAA
jgi:hypothetical protein